MYPFPLQMWVYSVPAFVAALLTLVAFWWKEPWSPPAPSAEKTALPFLKGLRKVNGVTIVAPFVSVRTCTCTCMEIL